MCMSLCRNNGSSIVDRKVLGVDLTDWIAIVGVIVSIGSIIKYVNFTGMLNTVVVEASSLFTKTIALLH